MSVYISQIKKLLSKKAGANRHRKIIVLAGKKSWQKNTLIEILHKHTADSLWVAEQSPEIDGISFIPPNKAVNWLGNEKRIVVFDANTHLNPDSFAAISGIVVGGGIFFLLMPEKSQWSEVYSSLFGRRFIHSIYSDNNITVLNEMSEEAEFRVSEEEQVLSEMIEAPFLSLDQQLTVETIKQQVFNSDNNHIALTADRGRGKSAAIGLVVASLLQKGIREIAITAPGLRATDIIFKHIEAGLVNSVEDKITVSRGRVSYNKCTVTFYSPDQLRLENIAAEVLFVDEAAAIPVTVLSSFLDKYQQCIFATTVHGYEGTGRGFALRFNKIMTEKNPAWLDLKMTTPVRWREGDPLEKWMFRLLCLDSDIAPVSLLKNITYQQCENSLVNKETLIKNEPLLNEIFALLVLAHYRTRPKDLKSLLDNENITLYVSLYHNHVVAVALVMAEGLFSSALSTEVYRGKRRPSGHLLAQALTYHCGIEHAATLNFARIMRIAVHPAIQAEGLGSWLLDFICKQEKNNGRDAIGTSFGLNEMLLRFWRKAGFNVVRLGFTREQTSGEHAVIMMRPLNNEGADIYDEAVRRFNRQCPFWRRDILKDIPAAIMHNLYTEIQEPYELTESDKKDLLSFVKYSRNYELCIAAINKLVCIYSKYINKKNFPINFNKIINYKTQSNLSWKEIVVKMNLIGKTDARRLFQQAISFIVKEHKL